VSRGDAQIPKALELPNALVSSKHHHTAYTRHAIRCAHLYTYIQFELLFVFKSILKEISWFSDLLAYYEQSRYESHPGILYKFAFANQEGCSLTRVDPSDHFNVAYDVWGCNNKYQNRQRTHGLHQASGFFTLFTGHKCNWSSEEHPRCPNYKQGGWSMLGDRRVLSSHAGERWVRGSGLSGCRAPLTKRLGAAYVADMPTRFHYCARAPSSCSPSTTINILHIYIRIYVCMYTCILYVLSMLKCICVYTDTDTATDTATDTCR
jgi:hypothetical protein